LISFIFVVVGGGGADYVGLGVVEERGEKRRGEEKRGEGYSNAFSLTIF